MRTIVAVLVALPSLAQPPQPQPARGIEYMEQQVAKNPENLQERQALLNLYYGAGNPGGRFREPRRRHILWFIEHHPEFPNLWRETAILDPKDDPEGHAQAARLWKEQASKEGAAPRVVANAVAFFQRTDLPTAFALLDARSKDPLLTRARGELQVLTLLGVTSIIDRGQVGASSRALRQSPEAARTLQEIEASNDPDLLGAAGAALQRYSVYVQQTGPYNFRPDPSIDQNKFRDWAERWLTKAHDLAPQEELWTAGLVRAYERRTYGYVAPEEQVKWLRKADALASRDDQRASFLPRLAIAEFENGDLAAAERIVERLFKFAENPRLRQPEFTNVAHTVLGRIALERDDIAAAKSRLLSSAQSDTRYVNAPNLTLAQELLDAGEKAAVLEFLEKLRAVWRYDQGRLDHLIKVAKLPGGDLLATWFPEGMQLITRPAPAEFKAGEPTVLLFRKEECGACDETSRVVDTVAREFTGRGVVFRSIDGGKDRTTAAAYMVESYPTLVSIDRQGRVAGYQVGGGVEAIVRRQIETALQGAPQRGPVALPAPVTRPVVEIASGKAILVWDAVEGAESYVVQWESNRDPGFVRVIATRETSASLEPPSGVAIRWRVQAVGIFPPPGKLSAWQEIPVP